MNLQSGVLPLLNFQGGTLSVLYFTLIFFAKMTAFPYQDIFFFGISPPRRRIQCNGLKEI
ncbi:hypothetical protein NSE_0484 [Neorickettsia sennetsu str. Miyayama]|uniref:Uncharacterized protein n=1 Tax=Ehrlichia sennetsu (strain ATCC VR-367 / Miyayama) TaxID=222891 RepID=Q2GDS8_EHRS3|nr:hypothetical protein NSE_0484 [Neorickettsia sennetsu str. Miyayama]